MATKREATIDDLYHVEGKAEIVNGELVLLPMTSGLHGFAALEIAASLRDYARRTQRGHAVTPTIFRRSEQAEAEPALPGWSMPVDDLIG
jgi:Uma2 family endonuclease